MTGLRLSFSEFFEFNLQAFAFQTLVCQELLQPVWLRMLYFKYCLNSSLAGPCLNRYNLILKLLVTYKRRSQCFQFLLVLRNSEMKGRSVLFCSF